MGSRHSPSGKPVSAGAGSSFANPGWRHRAALSWARRREVELEDPSILARAQAEETPLASTKRLISPVDHASCFSNMRHRTLLSNESARTAARRRTAAAALDTAINYPARVRRAVKGESCSTTPPFAMVPTATAARP